MHMLGEGEGEEILVFRNIQRTHFMNDLYGVIEITFKNTNVIKKGKIYVDIFLMLSIT